jgi:hypothetical protein
MVACLLIHGQEKLTQLCLCESPLNLGSKFDFCSQEAKISLMSKCESLILKEDLKNIFEHL